jgi:PKD repeat protein
LSELQSYITDLGINSDGTKIRNLRIDFDYDGGDLNIFTPCKLIIEDNRTVNVNGNSCLIALDDFRVDSGATYKVSGDVIVESQTKAVFQADSNLDIGGNIETIITRAEGDSEILVRNGANLKVGGEFTMRAFRRVRIGKNVTADIDDGLRIFSRGETLPDEDSDWASIGSGTVINSRNVILNAKEKVSVANDVTINAQWVDFDAIDCKIRNGAILNVDSKEGNCFSGNHPEAKFKVTPNSGNAPMQVFLNGDKSTSANSEIIKYHWEFVGFGTVTTTIPTTSYTFTTPGEYRIRLTVENALGLKNTASRVVVVAGGDNMPPVANFTIDNTEIVSGESIHVDASSSTDDYRIKRYHWSLSNGTTLSTRDDKATFRLTDVGDITISLEVEDFFGVRSPVVSQTVTVTPNLSGEPIKPYFIIETDSSFSDFSVYNRSINGDSTIASIYYEVDGVRYESTDITYGAETYLGELNHDGDLDIEIFVTDNFGNITSYREVFTLTSDLSPRSRFDLVQSEPLFAFVKAIDSYDPYDDIELIRVDWGDGNITEEDSDRIRNLYFTNAYQVSGTYDVTLTIETGDGRSESTTKSITVTDQEVETINPTALFEVRRDSAFGSVRFFLSGSGSPNGRIDGYSWEMGDGNTIIGVRDVTYFYDSGIYPVTLTVTDSAGFSSSQTQMIVITEDSDPLIIDPNCNEEANQGVECNINVGHRYNGLTELQINWGDGSSETINAENPTFFEFENVYHQYSEAGNYTITFTAITNNGDSATESRDVSFGNSGNMRPVVNFECSVSDLSSEVFCYTDGSYDPDGFISYFEYEFEGGNIITTSNGDANYVYSGPGTYDITVTAYDQFGLASIPETRTFEIFGSVNQPPVVQLNCESNEAFKVTCNAFGSFDENPGISYFEYKFYGDTVEQIVRYDDSNFDYNFGSSGTKQIDLTVYDFQGASSTATVFIDVLGGIAPVALFSCESLAVGELSCDGSSSSDLDGQIISYEWTINGQGYFGQAVGVDGVNTETALVQLKVTDNNNQTNIATSNIPMYINEPPVANFECISNAINELECSSLSTDIDGQITEHIWESEGNILQGQSVTFNYSSGGSKEIKLTVTDDSNDQGEITKSFVVTDAQTPNPIIAFNNSTSINQVTEGLQNIATANFSTSEDGTIESYTWSIDEVEIVSDQDLDLSSYGPGIYQVSLTVLSSFGKTSTVTKSLIVASNVVPEVIVSDITQFAPKTVSLSIGNTNDFVGVQSIEWIYSKEEKSTQDQNAQLTLNFLGGQEIFVRVIDVNGAVYTTRETVLVENNGPYIEGFESIAIIPGTGIAKSPLDIALDENDVGSYSLELQNNYNGVNIVDNELIIDTNLITNAFVVEVNLIDENQVIVYSRSININIEQGYQIENLSAEESANYQFNAPNTALDKLKFSNIQGSSRESVNLITLSNNSNQGVFRLSNQTMTSVKLDLSELGDSVVTVSDSIESFNFEGLDIKGDSTYYTSVDTEVFITSNKTVTVTPLSSSSEPIGCYKEELEEAKQMRLNGNIIDISGINSIAEFELSSFKPYIDLIIDNSTGINSEIYITDTFRNESFCKNPILAGYVTDDDKNRIYINIENLKNNSLIDLESYILGILIHEKKHLEIHDLFNSKVSNRPFSNFEFIKRLLSTNTVKVIKFMSESNAQNAVLESNMTRNQKEIFFNKFLSSTKNDKFITYLKTIKSSLKTQGFIKSNNKKEDTNIGYYYPYNFNNEFERLAINGFSVIFNDDQFKDVYSSLLKADVTANNQDLSVARNKFLKFYIDLELPFGSNLIEKDQGLIFDLFVEDTFKDNVKDQILDNLSIDSLAETISIEKNAVNFTVFKKDILEQGCSINSSNDFYDCIVTPAGRYKLNLNITKNDISQVGFLNSNLDYIDSIGGKATYNEEIENTVGSSEYENIMSLLESNNPIDPQYGYHILYGVNFEDTTSSSNNLTLDISLKEARIKSLSEYVEDLKYDNFSIEDIDTQGNYQSFSWIENCNELTDTCIDNESYLTFISEANRNAQIYSAPPYPCPSCGVYTDGIPKINGYLDIKIASFKNTDFIVNNYKIFGSTLEFEGCVNDENTVTITLDPRSDKPEQVNIKAFDDYCDTITNNECIARPQGISNYFVGVAYSKNYMTEVIFNRGFTNSNGCDESSYILR